jgi:hypothetical protein
MVSHHCSTRLGGLQFALLELANDLGNLHGNTKRM